MLFCDPKDPLHRKHIKCRYTSPKRREDKTRGVVNLVRIIAGGGCIMLFLTGLVSIYGPQIQYARLKTWCRHVLFTFTLYKSPNHQEINCFVGVCSEIMHTAASSIYA